jgi:hypothetical protein
MEYQSHIPGITQNSSPTSLGAGTGLSDSPVSTHLSMLRGVNKVGGSPSMWRGRAGGVGCCGELSEDGERLPPSLASGSCRAGKVENQGQGRD